MNIKPHYVAVVTGAASGIGLSLVKSCAEKGMKVVACDINSEALTELSGQLEQRGVTHMVWHGDIADPTAVAELADSTYRQFGQVNLLCNNAGIMHTGLSWECSTETWQQTLNINLMGAVYCIREFIPRMLNQRSPGHIVNTSSLAGLLSAPMMGAYAVSKHALVALSETLLYELCSLDANIGVSVLCPAQVASNIMNTIDHSDQKQGSTNQLNDYLRAGIREGMDPGEVANTVLSAVEANRFWIFTHPQFKAAYRTRTESLLNEFNPHYHRVEC